MSSPAQLPGCASSTVSPREIRHAAVCRQIAAEGMVLLKNDGILPLAADAETALYGAIMTSYKDQRRPYRQQP